MMNRYLNSDPIPWLIDGKEPAVTYHAKREFCSTYDHDQIYNELESSPLTDFFLNKSLKNILGDIKNPDLVNRGTIWFFLWAVECGYKSETTFIARTAEFITEKFRTEDGGFSLNLQPKVPLACRTGDIVRSFLKTGIKDERTTAGLKWIEKHQRKDGGWLHCPFNGFCDLMKMFIFKKTGSGIHRETRQNIQSCPVATLSCLKALSSAQSDSLYSSAIESGISFLLDNKHFFAGSVSLSCGLLLYPSDLGYPVMSQFDILSFMIEIFKTKLRNDPRCKKMFNLIIKKQSPNGTWNLENNSRGMIPYKKGENRFVTLNVLRMLNLILKHD